MGLFEEREGDARGGRAHEHAQEDPSDLAQQVSIHAGRAVADLPDDARREDHEADRGRDDEHALGDVEVFVDVRVPRVVHGQHGVLEGGDGSR